MQTVIRSNGSTNMSPWTVVRDIIIQCIMRKEDKNPKIFVVLKDFFRIKPKISQSQNVRFPVSGFECLRIVKAPPLAKPAPNR